MATDLKYKPLHLVEPEEPLVLREGGSYTYSDYTRSDEPIHDILARFDVRHHLDDLELPRSNAEISILESLFQTLQRNRRHALLDSEAAQREFLLAPVIMEIAYLAGAFVNVEYPLRVADDLTGRLDYFIKSNTNAKNLIVIEAKRGIPELGFVQLAVQLIALSRSGKTDADSLFGAVVAGGTWWFGRLDVSAAEFIQGLNHYDATSGPDQLETIIRTVVGILSGDTTDDPIPS